MDLSKFDNSWHKPANKLKIILWYFTNMFLFKTMMPLPSSIKVIKNDNYEHLLKVHCLYKWFNKLNCSLSLRTKCGSPPHLAWITSCRSDLLFYFFDKNNLVKVPYNL